MSSSIMSQPSRKLPSLDWIVLVVGVVGLVFNRLPEFNAFFGTGIMGLVVFGPPALRELGILKDDDEYTRNIRWRAGFHTALAMALFVFLNHMLLPLLKSYPDFVHEITWFFPNGFLRQTIVLVFLLSYLIQYWGAAQGVFRILLGVAGLTVIEVGMMGLVITHGKWDLLMPMLGWVLLVVGLAYLARKRPHLAGWTLILFGFAAIVTAAILSQNQGPPDLSETNRLGLLLGTVQASVQVLLVFVISGVALLQSETSEVD